MERNYSLLTLWLHAVLVVLASTELSVLSWIWGDSSWTWQYFRYSYQSGWGYQYQSDYRLAVVLTYVAAYSLGVVAHSASRRRVSLGWSVPARVLSALGLISFLIEGSHWLWAHNLSWIAISPAASLVLAVGAIVQLGRTRGKPAERAGAPNGVSPACTTPPVS